MKRGIIVFVISIFASLATQLVTFNIGYFEEESITFGRVVFSIIIPNIFYWLSKYKMSKSHIYTAIIVPIIMTLLELSNWFVP